MKEIDGEREKQAQDTHKEAVKTEDNISDTVDISEKNSEFNGEMGVLLKDKDSITKYEKIGILTKRPIVDFTLKQQTSDFIVEELFFEEDKNGYNHNLNLEIMSEYFNIKEISDLSDLNVDKDQRILCKSLSIDEKQSRKILHKELNKMPHILTETNDGTIKIFKSNEKGIFSFIMRKENRDTVECIQDLSRELNVKFEKIKFAGNKDRSAITYQRVSVEGVYLEQIQHFPHIRREREHLRLGKFFGNKFTIILRRVPENHLSLDRAIQNIEIKKIPNFFGPQRFGRHSDNHIVGELIHNKKYKEAIDMIMKTKKNDTDYVQQAKTLFHSKKYDEAYKAFPKNCMAEKTISKTIQNGHRHAIFSIKKTLRVFYLHAYQSYKFNLDLSQLLIKSEEVSFLFLSGSKSKRATFIEPQDLLIVPHSHGYQMSFILPPSAYATIVIREFIGDCV